MWWREVAYLCLRSLFLALLVLCSTQVEIVFSSDGISELSFQIVTLNSTSSFSPRRLISPGWGSVPSVLRCVQRTVTDFPESRGFLYKSTSGLCTPVLWLESASAAGAYGITDEEGTLYLVPGGVCADDFELVEYGSGGLLACIKDHPETVDYAGATSACNALGAHLADVRTADKLSLVQKISSGNDRWLGADDIAEEGRFFWQIDGKELTSEEIDAVFRESEPNDWQGAEDCIQFRKQTQLLNDIPCSSQFGFICEIALPTYT